LVRDIRLIEKILFDTLFRKQQMDKGSNFLRKYMSNPGKAPKIRVNCIVPGGIQNNQGKKFISKYSELTPMKRMMKRTELNGLIDYLCSENSSYVTGSVLVCDGGYTSW